MWVLKFIPNAVFYVTFFAGLVTYLVAGSVKLPLNMQTIKNLAGLVIVVSIFFMGVVYNNNAWLARVAELETKVAAAEQQSQQVTEKIVNKVVYKTQIVRERGSDITKYIDREVVKYDNTCPIPDSFVQAHNRAAEVPK